MAEVSMRRYLALVAVAMLPVMTLAGCGISPSDKSEKRAEPNASALHVVYETPLSLAKLPAAGYIDLSPADQAGLDSLGLGGPWPLGAPYSPFNEFGMYWSQPFSLVEGDTLQVKVYSDTPVSWFGVDWSYLDIRGVVATTEMDEDGRSFDPQYPSDLSADAGPNGYVLTLTYDIHDNTSMVLVVKNANTDRSERISVDVTSKSTFSVRRFFKDIPIIKYLIKPDHNDTE